MVLMMLVLAITGCGAATQQQPTAIPSTTATLAVESSLADAHNDDNTATGLSSSDEETGVLQVYANGEDFIRQGFTTKDGWDIAFDHVYVTLAQVKAYQTDPPYDAHEGGDIQAVAKTIAKLANMYTVDLAAGDETANPILVDEIPQAPVGRYNALSWDMVAANDGAARGAVIMLQGQAVQDATTITFTIRLNNASSHTCGDYVGDERKGILEANDTANVEATFHFDHIFGDANMPMDDSLNMGALGFAPLAALATDGELDVDMATLQAQLSPEDYAKLAHVHLAHVGEGHCTGETH
jgi:hypothetical protein